MKVIAACLMLCAAASVHAEDFKITVNVDVKDAAVVVKRAEAILKARGKVGQKGIDIMIRPNGILNLNHCIEIIYSDQIARANVALFAADILIEPIYDRERPNPQPEIPADEPPQESQASLLLPLQERETRRANVQEVDR